MASSAKKAGRLPHTPPAAIANEKASDRKPNLNESFKRLNNALERSNSSIAKDLQ
jgi:hypothetical protein